MEKRTYRRFQCYFCNKLIDNESEIGHAATCSRVLESCPFKCGSYIPRSEMNKHKRECANSTKNSISKSMANLSQIDKDYHLNSPSLGRNGLFAKQTGYSTSQESQVKQSNGRKLSIQSVDSNLDTLTNMFNHLKRQIQNLYEQYNSLLQWKVTTDLQIDKIRESVSYYQTSKSNSDKVLLQLQDKYKILNELQYNINKQKELIFSNQFLNSQMNSELSDNFVDFKNKTDEQIESVLTTINLQSPVIEDVNIKIEQINRSVEDIKSKLTNIVFDLRATAQIASGTEDKLEILERENKLLRQEIEQLKLDVENTDGALLKSSTLGKLMWKVVDIKNKMKVAKETNCYYKSPIFYSHEYGYKIRVILYLNGLNKWRDRYALICLEVLEGDYDLMLKWPCHIEGNITVRDLENLNYPKHFSKTIISKRESPNDEGEEPQESSSQFIFIPHSVLLKEKYIQNNTTFIEVFIDRVK